MNAGRRSRSHSRPPRAGHRPRSQSIAIPSRSRASPSPAPGKSKRVRTGCLTCRERHLKCDEAVPDCNNCQRSNRECRRGIRLNFIDIQVGEPPCLPSTSDWSFQILDESRSIAAEYEGGLGRYPGADVSPISPGGDGSPIQTSNPQHGSGASASAEPNNSHEQQPGMAPSNDGYDQGLTHSNNTIYPPHPNPFAPSSQTHDFALRSVDAFTGSFLRTRDVIPEEPIQHEPGSHKTDGDPMVLSPCIPQSPMLPLPVAFRPSSVAPRFSTPSGLMTPSSETTTGERDYLNTDDEIHLMQVFVDEVAIWMDALDKDKHFTNVVPYLALKQPMLFNALLACGAQHLALTGAGDQEKADYYYGLASGELQRCQQERNRDLTECALTAVVLNAYDIMTDNPAQRMQHIASTRALLMECGWDASSGGLGAACFWVNVGMEVLSCLSFGWPTAWDPDQWGLDLEFASLGAASSKSGSRSVIGSDDVWRIARGDSQSRMLPGASVMDGAEGGDEELWVHRIFYIMAKVANFRANTPQFQEPSPHDEQVRLQARFSEWRRLQNMCNAWNSNCPRSMRPYGYSPGPSATSLFPNVWLIKSPAKLGRLFYHTAMALLAQTHPLDRKTTGGDPRAASRENLTSRLHHAHHVCGVVAHSRLDRDRDRGVVRLAIRCLEVVSPALEDPKERKEVLNLLERVGKETGWRLGRVMEELKMQWGHGNIAGGDESGKALGRAGGSTVAMGLAGLSLVPEGKMGQHIGLGDMAFAIGDGRNNERGSRDWG